MKKTIVCLLIIIGIIQTPLFAANNETKSDFRKAAWGMSREEIIALEKQQPLRIEGDTIVFNGIHYEEPCEIIYIFKEGRLIQGKYLFTKPNQDMSMYEEIGNQIDQDTGVTQFNFVYQMLKNNPSNISGGFDETKGGEGQFGMHFKLGRNKITLIFAGKYFAKKYRGQVSIEYELYSKQ